MPGKIDSYLQLRNVSAANEGTYQCSARLEGLSRAVERSKATQLEVHSKKLHGLFNEFLAIFFVQLDRLRCQGAKFQGLCEVMQAH